jgi:hypothetical protein
MFSHYKITDSMVLSVSFLPSEQLQCCEFFVWGGIFSFFPPKEVTHPSEMKAVVKAVVWVVEV